MTFFRWARTQWDRVTAWVCIGLGALAVILGWVAVGREPLTAQQIPYVVSGGIGGLFLLGLGAMLWLSADLRDEWRKLDAIERQGRPALDAADDDPFDHDGGTGDDTGEDALPDPTTNGTTPAAPRRRRPARAS